MVRLQKEAFAVCTLFDEVNALLEETVVDILMCLTCVLLQDVSTNLLELDGMSSDGNTLE